MEKRMNSIILCLAGFLILFVAGHMALDRFLPQAVDSRSGFGPLLLGSAVWLGGLLFLTARMLYGRTVQGTQALWLTVAGFLLGALIGCHFLLGIGTVIGGLTGIVLGPVIYGFRHWLAAKKHA